MKPLATGRLVIALCGALLPALFAPSATARQNPANKRSSVINLIYPNGLAIGEKSFKVLAELDPATLKKHLPYFRRFIATLDLQLIEVVSA